MLKGMLRRIQQTIHERNLISPGDRIIAGVSGGADSTAMLYALWFLSSRQSFHVTAVHLHHGFRGEDADRDAEAVEQLCFRLEIPLVMKREDVAKTRCRSGVSFEMAAREARQDFFAEVIKEAGARSAAVAHTRNDQAETILMRVLSGAGPDGLSGIAYRNEPAEGLHVIRPLLDVSRDELESFLRAHGIQWREDKSNRDSRYMRNRVRHMILPHLEENGFPHVNHALVRLGDIMREESALQTNQTTALLKACRCSAKKNRALSAAKLNNLSLAEKRRVVRAWLGEHPVGGRAIEFSLVDRIVRLSAKPRDGEVMISALLRVKKSGDLLQCCEPSEAPVRIKPVQLMVPGVTEIPEAGLVVRVSRSHGFWRTPGKLGKYPAVTYLERRGDQAEMFIRSRLPGDAITPTGMRGRVFLKELLINEKVPVERRGEIPVLVADGRVVWVAGYRVAREWAVPSEGAPSWKVVIEQKPR